MGKKITTNELSEIVTALLIHPELLGQFDQLKHQKSFMLEIAETVSRHCGGSIGGISDEDGESLMVSVDPNEGIESLNRNVWCLHDRDGWSEEDCSELTDVEAGEVLSEKQVQLVRQRIQHSLIKLSDEVDFDFNPDYAMTIQFDIKSGSATQTILPLDSSLSAEDIALGLSTGQYVTTQNNCSYERSYIIENATDERIAIILQHDIIEAEYSDFKDFDTQTGSVKR
ncbi:hypothetical protein V6259_12895 [Marinomonas sp. TI.3.20]|uniref:hypothetical protein n=1 Tax=Marinomonas sp. TI.3.20 TaxID=3121296 RepID=UPI00311FB104